MEALADAQANNDDETLAHAKAAAEDAIRAFEKGAADLAAEMRAGTANNDAGNILDKSRLDALAHMGRVAIVEMRATRRRAAPPPAMRRRDTKPRHLVRWGAVAEVLFREAPIGERIGLDHALMQRHDLHVALMIGDDLTPDEKPAEAYLRLCQQIGSYVATDLMLDAAERDENGHADALILAGQMLAPIAIPPGEDEQRLHTRLLAHVQIALLDRPGTGPVPSRDDQQRARHEAWRLLVEEERQSEEHHRQSAGQTQRELAALLPGWAAALGMTVAR